MEKHNTHFQCGGHCMMITSPQLADRLGKSRKTVAMYCQKLGIPKLGSIYAMTEAQAAQVKAVMHERSGRPPGPQPWIAEGITRQAWHWRQKKRERPLEKATTNPKKGKTAAAPQKKILKRKK